MKPKPPEGVRAELHSHSTASDGVLRPAALVKLAAERGLDALALTDHDTMEGLAEASAACAERGMTFIPGVEISTVYQGASIHVLGYGVPPENSVLKGFLERFRAQKFSRAVRILERLSALNMPMRADDLPGESRENLGRAHIARAMVAKGYAASVDEAFDRFLLSGRPAYIPKEKAGTGEAVSALKAAGALAVIAHPEQILLERGALLKGIQVWQALGLDGVEAYHPSHSAQQAAFWLHYARQDRLLVTGGSDFHETPPRGAQHAELGASLERWPDSARDIRAFFERIRRME